MLFKEWGFTDGCSCDGCELKRIERVLKLLVRKKEGITPAETKNLLKKISDLEMYP